MPRVLVTGATGFLGGALARTLRQEGKIEVVAAARTQAPGIAHAADLADPRAVAALVAAVRPDAIVHAAGLRHGAPKALAAANVATVRTLLRAVADRGLKPRVLLIGSAAEYGVRAAPERLAERAACRPASAYGRSKLAATRLGLWFRQRHGLPVTTLRLFNVVGPGMAGLIGEAIAFLAGRGPPLDWSRDARSLPMVRDFAALADVGEVFRRALLRDGALPAVLNVCTGQAASFAAMLERLDALGGGRLAPPPGTGAVDFAVGDPALCARTLGFSPGSDVRDALQAALAAARS